LPPTTVNTLREEIYWQYAKLISKSAGFEIRDRAFQMATFIKLRDGKIRWSSAIGEYVKEHERKNACIYCGSTEKLTLEHILPLSRGGPNTADNAIFVCKKCNSSKGSKRLYEWFGYVRRDEIPSIAEGKYLKLIFDMHDKKGTLDLDKHNLHRLCVRCDMEESCKRIGKQGKLTVYCLEGIFTKPNSEQEQRTLD
jgi:hypothetical protein